ncbi:cerebellin-1-like [Littorina saxatilis]|uniref:C1q domain-containing protein n=1 Tax=Littorina saxatilis TaxID=31220 RepID=A0AAN9FZW6_9CAEN
MQDTPHTMENRVFWLTFIALVIRTEVTSANVGHVMRKRSDDPHPLEAVVSRLAQDLTQLQARVTALENAKGKRVAFLAMETTEGVKAHVPIPFSPVFNLGNGYDPQLHVFVAPYSGIYIFNFQIFCNQPGDLLVDLIKNGHIAVRMRVFDQTYNTSEASSVTQQVTSGDRFWIVFDRDVSLHNGVHSFFSGTLVSADD